jgi:Zn-dependent peptidase ImmA (M78 family)
LTGVWTDGQQTPPSRLLTLADGMPGRNTNVGAKHAREARAELGIDAAAALECILAVVEERARLPVVVTRLPERIAGACWREGAATLLWINGRQPPVRQRFTVAHEFGHVRCGHADGLTVDAVDTLADDTHDPREVQANAFAAEFLAPREGVQALVAGEPTLETVVAIAARFGISTIAALYRLSTLGLTRRADRLKAEIDEGLHLAVWDAVYVPVRDDGLARIDVLPRISPQLAGSRLAARLAGAL